mmetsp:Transcript_22344/g.26896  ORF Transcript_22344/g.26896 Transcript_22344/m.26896 type:complete len:504 (+) Transcript_22344:186-1697(+)
MQTQAWLCKLVLLITFFAAISVEGKVVDSELTLSSLDSEVEVTKFSFSAGAMGTVRGEFRSDVSKWRNQRHRLQAYLYNDVQWVEFHKQLEKGSLCGERVRVASATVDIQLLPDIDSLAPKDKKQLAKKRDRDYNFKLDLPTLRERSHYWYVLVADCELEWYDARNLPPVKYHLEFMNGNSHLPADEVGILALQGTVFVLLAVGAAYFGKTLVGHYQKQQRVHLMVLLLAVAYWLQMTAIFFEMIHLIRYKSNGVGSGIGDFLSRLFQSLSELLMCFLLIFLACGWTTVTLGDAAAAVAGPDAKKGGVTKGSMWQTLMEHAELKRYFTAYARTLRRPAAMASKVSVGSCMVALLTAAHIFLTLYGLQFMEETSFTQYHDHEHWPGYMLMCLRVGLWVLFLGGGWATMSTIGKADAVAKFLKKLALAGTVWLLAFPFSVVTAGMIPVYMRHSFVTLFALLCQSFALIGCLQLVCTDNFRGISSVAIANTAGALDGKRMGKVAVD